MIAGVPTPPKPRPRMLPTAKWAGPRSDETDVPIGSRRCRVFGIDSGAEVRFPKEPPQRPPPAPSPAAPRPSSAARPAGAGAAAGASAAGAAPSRPVSKAKWAGGRANTPPPAKLVPQPPPVPPPAHVVLDKHIPLGTATAKKAASVGFAMPPPGGRLSAAGRPKEFHHIVFCTLTKIAIRVRCRLSVDHIEYAIID